MRRLVLALGAVAIVLGAAGPAEALAQAGPGELGRQTLRPYAHVFVAYAVAWILVLGWVVSIARRLGRIEEEVEEGSED